MPTADDATLEVARLTLYPFKALDGVDVPVAEALRGGGLAGDRCHALVDADGYFVNGKRTAEMHRVRAVHDLEAGTVALTVEGFEDEPEVFHPRENEAALAEWFSDYLGMTVRLAHDVERGFPDDEQCSGPTLVSTATLELVGEWFGGMDLDEVRGRFRANVELRASAAFAEERLFRADRRPVPFFIGDAALAGMQPCVRCIVPTRGSRDGESLIGFQSTFERARGETMPAFVEQGAFESLYSLTVNTLVERTGVMRVGDRLLG